VNEVCGLYGVATFFAKFPARKAGFHFRALRIGFRVGKGALGKFDIRGTVHHSTVYEEHATKCKNLSEFLLFHIYIKLNMFRSTHHPSSGA
jgi:hypothetical protein